MIGKTAVFSLDLSTVIQGTWFLAGRELKSSEPEGQVGPGPLLMPGGTAWPAAQAHPAGRPASRTAGPWSASAAQVCRTQPRSPSKVSTGGDHGGQIGSRH